MLKVERRGFLQKLVSILLIVLTFFSVCSIRAFADSTMVSFRLSVQDDIKAFDEYLDSDDIKSDKKYKVSAAKGDVDYAMADIITGSSSIGIYSINKTEFKKLERSSQQKLVEDLINELKDTKYSNTAAQEISDALKEVDHSIIIPSVVDISADMFTAYKWVAPFLNVIRVILGVLAIAVLLILVLSTIVDCCYIGLPVAREKMGNKDGQTSKKPGYVSFDAYKTVQEAESSMVADKDYKNPFASYFKRRTVTYIILALCLFYLVAGELSGLISWLLSLVSGITGG